MVADIRVFTLEVDAVGPPPRSVPWEDTPAMRELADGIYNIGGEFSRNGKGFLQGPPAVWVEQLTELTLVHGVSGYILCRVESGDIVRRFADEVVPAIRNAVRAERGTAQCRGPG